MPEISLGFLPAAAGTQTLPKFIGLNNTLDLILTRKVLSAKDALSIGLVDRVVDVENLESESLTLAKNIKNMNQHLIRAAKKSVSISDDVPLEKGILLEKRVFQRFQSRI